MTIMHIQQTTNNAYTTNDNNAYTTNDNNAYTTNDNNAQNRWQIMHAYMPVSLWLLCKQLPAVKSSQR